MKRAVVGLAGAIVLVVIVWLAGGHRERRAEPVTEAVATAATTAEAMTTTRAPAAGSAATARPRGTTGAPTSAGSPGATTASTAPAAARTAPRPGAAPVPAASAGAAVGAETSAPAAHALTDRTGWSDASITQQLDHEFMPLASECIDQAKARAPGLRGLLAFSMLLAPTDAGKAIVTSIKLRPDNQITDPELFECIRESSFSLDGLKAPHDFDITMPIEPDTGAGGSGRAAR